MENEASQSQGQVRKCPFCSELIQSDAKKCRFCGEWLDVKKDKIETIPIVENKSASLKSTENNKRGLKIIGIIILVMIAISLWYISIPILIIWYLFYKTDLGKKAFIVIKNKSEAIGHKKILIRISLAVVAIMAISVIIAYPDRKPTIAIMEPQNNAEIQSDRVLIRGSIGERIK